MDLSVLGSLAGSAAGNAVAPGVGGMIGSQLGGQLGHSLSGGSGGGGSGGSGHSGSSQAAFSLATGLLEQIQAAKLKKKADSAFPDLIDPNQSAFLAELAQKRKSLETGADFSAGMNAIDASNAGTNEAITRNTGGDVGGTIQALLQSERVANDSKNNVIAQGQQQQMANTQMFENMLNKISARSMQLQLARSQQSRAEWAKMKQQANQNTMAGIGNALSSMPSATPTAATTPSLSQLPTGKGFGKFSNGNEAFIDNGVIDDASLNTNAGLA